jgi:leader peptidase (prepilin peptidase)/N-methyltransferase
MPETVVIVISGLFGLVIGSFLNVVAWRVPRGESINAPASHCPVCETPLRPIDNIPVISWVLLRGRCHFCATAISARYPLVELATGALFALLALALGWTWLLPVACVMAAVALVLAVMGYDKVRSTNWSGGGERPRRRYPAAH